jgi:hypothetical protein
MCAHLKQLGIVATQNVDQLIDDELFCQPAREDCRFRNCVDCQTKNITISEFSNDAEEFYESWESRMEVGRDGVTRRKTIKERIVCETRKMVEKFVTEVVPLYVEHKALDYHQKKTMKNLKISLTLDDVLVHIDFAENYSCKYGREIQSIHFGGNRRSITLHTGVKYHDKSVQSFCTFSKDPNHNPVAIWHHLQPILEEYVRGDQVIKNLHFLSDSPSTQYRNKNMFYILIKKIIPMFLSIESVTWNYSEAGHGKGAPDGVGGTIKRVCDAAVSHNHDISDFTQFFNYVSKNIEGIQIIPVNSTEDVELEAEVKESVTVKGEHFLEFLRNFFTLNNIIRY